MRSFLTILAALALTLTGCSSVSRTAYPLTDPDKTSAAFVESVREYYATRTDGKLGDPILSAKGARFVFRYERLQGDRYAEAVELSLRPARTSRNNDGTTEQEAAAYTVGAWFHREGPDPEALAVRDAVLAGMAKRLP